MSYARWFLSVTRRRLLWLTVTLVVLLVPIPVAAQIIPEPRPPVILRPPAPGAIDISEYTVHASIDGPVAEVTVTQVFYNQSGATVEGQYIFPLPAQAAVSDFQMKVDGAVLEGRLLPADQARTIYEQIVRQQRDPALLQYFGGGLFQTNVFPIPPGGTRAVQLKYTEIVGLDQGLFRFRYPVAAGFTGYAPSYPLRMDVELTNQPGLRTIYSPDAGVAVTRAGPDAAHVEWGGSAAGSDGTVDLFWGLAGDLIGANLLSFQPIEEDGYLAMLLSPSLAVEQHDIVARDLIVVLDVSGSMEGAKMEQARASADYLVDHLNPGDRFNLVSFSTGVRRWANGLMPASPESALDAHEWIARLDAGGSTDINRALLESLAILEPAAGADGERLTYILFLTDGLPTQGETDPWRILDNAAENSRSMKALRLFPFGIGYDVNTVLLDTLAKQLGGRSSYVTPGQRIDEAVSAFYAGMSTPVLGQASVEFSGGAVVDDIYPYPLPDLFAGEQLVVTGRYRRGGPVSVVLRGEVNGDLREFRYDDFELRTGGGEPSVARLWAARKIGALSEQVRREGAMPEVIQAIVDLSLRYGIITPYTAYLVEEPQIAGPAAAPQAPSANVPGVGGGADRVDGAYAYAEEEAARQAAMPASGEAAVAASMAQNAMQEADAVGEAAQVRFLGGKTFIQQGWVTTADGAIVPFWVDTLFHAGLPLRWVTFGGDDYFSLAAKPSVASWLSIGPEVVFVDAEQAIRVTTDVDAVSRQTGASPEPAPTATVSNGPVEPAEDVPAKDAPENVWSEIWRWIVGDAVR